MSQKVDLKLDWCSYKAAKYAVEHWHYSKTMPTPPVLRIGIWEEHRFIGVILFSRGSNNNLCRAFGVKITEICELTRVAISTHSTPVSRLLSIALKLLRQSNSKLQVCISYADPNHGHYGGIYQANGWIYTGQTSPDAAYVDPSGRRWHSRQVSHTGVKRQYGSLRTVPKHRECQRVQLLGKYRYAMPFNTEMSDRIEHLAKPYPKRAASIVQDAPSDQGGEGGLQPTAALHLL